jgi:hypothetical protein
MRHFILYSTNHLMPCHATFSSFIFYQSFNAMSCNTFNQSIAHTSSNTRHEKRMSEKEKEKLCENSLLCTCCELLSSCARNEIKLVEREASLISQSVKKAIGEAKKSKEKVGAEILNPSLQQMKSLKRKVIW